MKVVVRTTEQDPPMEFDHRVSEHESRWHKRWAVRANAVHDVGSDRSAFATIGLRRCRSCSGLCCCCWLGCSHGSPLI